MSNQIINSNLIDNNIILEDLINIKKDDILGIYPILNNIEKDSEDYRKHIYLLFCDNYPEICRYRIDIINSNFMFKLK